MRILVERNLFLESCRLAGRVLPARTTDVARAHLLVQASAATCTLHAAGAGIALRLEVPAEVEQPGQALLPARQTLAILREAEADVLLLESVPGRVRVAAEEAEYDLASPAPTPLLPVESFPGGACHHVAAAELGRALQRTLFATGQATNRYALHAVLWEIEADCIRLVATDSRRLAVAEVPVELPGEQLTPTRHLLPGTALRMLAKLTAGVEGRVSILFGMRQAFFEAGTAILKARYVEGGFPVWRKALPGRALHIVPVVVGPFLSAARQAAAVRERQGGRLMLRFEPGRVLLESRKQGSARARVRQTLPLSGTVVEVALNPRYLVELLAAQEAESTLLFGVTGPGEPVVVSDGEGYRHVLMPLRQARRSD
jgi:DNA polymerase-3 subunit beta